MIEIGDIGLINILLTIIGFLVVYVLNGIKGEITDMKFTVNRLETDLRGGVSSLDRRISVVEERCKINHEHPN